MLEMVEETPSDRVMKVLEDPAYDQVREIVREHLRESSGSAAEEE